MNTQLIKFYTGGGEDHAGRTLKDILSFSPEEFEETHDYIQWLFPTLTKSLYSDSAPILDEPTVNVLRYTKATFPLSFGDAANLMFKFWGFKFPLGRLSINNKQPWMQRGNHNLLRMTRFMESSEIFGFEYLGRTLLEALLRTIKENPQFNFIEPINIYYWYRAAYGKI